VVPRADRSLLPQLPHFKELAAANAKRFSHEFSWGADPLLGQGMSAGDLSPTNFAGELKPHDDYELGKHHATSWLGYARVPG
jgi:hypothetical protein